MRDLLEQGIKSVILSPRGIEYPIRHPVHCDPYPEGVTTSQLNPGVYDRSVQLKVNVAKMLDFLGCDPKPKPKVRPIHRRWITREQYERQVALNPTVSTMLL